MDHGRLVAAGREGDGAWCTPPTGAQLTGVAGSRDGGYTKGESGSRNSAAVLNSRHLVLQSTLHATTVIKA